MSTVIALFILFHICFLSKLSGKRFLIETKDENKPEDVTEHHHESQEMIPEELNSENRQFSTFSGFLNQFNPRLANDLLPRSQG